MEAQVVQLRNVYLHVTTGCNLACQYCYLSARNPLPDEMVTADFERLWAAMAVIKPNKVIFTGGEPLLRTDLSALLQGLRTADPEHNILRCVDTNGHLISRDVASSLFGLADEVRVSLDALPLRNDTLRGAGNYDAAMRALAYLMNVGFEPKVLVTITSLSLPDLSPFLHTLLDNGVHQINLNVFRPIGRGIGKEHLLPDLKDVQRALEGVWKTRYPGHLIPTSIGCEQSCRNCGVGQYINIMPNGEVFPCHVLSFPELRCGNVREHSLLEICRRAGLLDRLSQLDFCALAQAEKELQYLLSAQKCLGDVYSKTRHLDVWQETLHS